MPDFSTIFRDLGAGPTIIGVGIIALIVFSILKGGSGKGNGSSKSNGGGNTPSAPTPPPASNG